MVDAHRWLKEMDAIANDGRYNRVPVVLLAQCVTEIKRLREFINTQVTVLNATEDLLQAIMAHYNGWDPDGDVADTKRVYDDLIDEETANLCDEAGDNNAGQ